MNSNRISKTSYAPTADGNCSTSTTATTVSSAFDTADRLQPSGSHSGLVYDAFGRVLTLPAADTSAFAGGDTTLTYYVTDMVKSTAVGTSHRIWTLDPDQRLRRQTAESGNSTAVLNHYAGGDDSPAWSLDTDTTGANTTTRYLGDLTGGMAATVAITGTTTVQWQLVDLHGDVARTTSPSATAAPDGALNNADEYGATTSTLPRYGYLGAAQRANDPTTALTYMGVRIYAPTLGQFLQTDPILGGNTTAYTYPTDPIMGQDLDGRILDGNVGGPAGHCGKKCQNFIKKTLKEANEKRNSSLLAWARRLVWAADILSGIPIVTWFCTPCKVAIVILGVVAAGIYYKIGQKTMAYLTFAGAVAGAFSLWAIERYIGKARALFGNPNSPIYKMLIKVFGDAMVSNLSLVIAELSVRP